ncbi:chemotaxis protein CheW [Belnapia rosea]|uniref:Chemotaxis protein CheW n=1 Tax=Belnapia rosea TaxID=938405 RepID=A0A1G7CZZ0_9PROT|nr:chemotaxis protein CheW [Belnapia rosea]SDE44246.1 CheW protein [Belnapia rosea]
MPDADQILAMRGAPARRFLTFRSAERLYALPAEEVSEVIRVPAVARVPQGPGSLLGIANLRGFVLPVASLRGLLGREEAAASPMLRAIVLDGAAPIVLVVDVVEALVTVEADRIETRQAQLAAEPVERLWGAFQYGPGLEVAKILDIQNLLSAAFVQRVRPPRSRPENSSAGPVPHDTEAEDDHPTLITFDVAGQEYALGLDVVQEVLPAPRLLAVMPHAEALVLGVVPFRNTLLPLLSLRGLLGFALSQPNEKDKILVTAVGGILVGLVADGIRAILPLDSSLVEPIPAVLAARSGGEARIKAIYRGEAGRRLISILAPEQLFREDVMRRLGTDHENPRPQNTEDDRMPDRERHFLVFHLGDDEFGLPIEAIDEVARVPGQITRLPKTPEFLEGVVNLRGEVLPVVDQRRRFGMPKLEHEEGRRLLVVRTERHRAGLIVDSVSGVLRNTSATLEPVPALTDETTRLVQGVLNLEDVGRMVPILDPTELLSRAERGLLDRLETATERPGL